MKQTNTKKTLIIGGTHGNEPIGPALLKIISNQSRLENFKTIIGNPRALKKNLRYIDADLNRVAPGVTKSKIYEEKRAAQLLKLFKNFDFIIDIHETKANDRLVIILPKLDSNSLLLALAFAIDIILIWPPSTPQKKTGPLVQFAKSGIEIECGTKNNFSLTLKKLTKIVNQFLTANINLININTPLTLKALEQKKFYLVYDRINDLEVTDIKLTDFVPVQIDKQKFIPLLFGSHQGLKGYKMKKLDNKTVLDTINLNKDL